MKNVLVTGACGGMGRAAVCALAGEGCRVFALDITPTAPEENIIPLVADVTEEADIAAAVARVSAITERIDAILHFAGMYMLDSLVEMESEAFDRIFRVNLRGVFLVNRAFLPLLYPGSRILITTSELAPLSPLPFTGIYAVSKGALDQYAFALRMELQLQGISVSVLRAGAVQTGMLHASTVALEQFCSKTTLYRCNAARFRQIVDRVEARCIPSEKLAKKALRILRKKRPSFAYSINRNPLLRLFSAFPQRIQCRLIRRILK